MSTKATGTKTTKVLETISKMDLDDAVNLYHDTKAQLTERLDERAKEYEEKQNRYLDIKEQINKNGK